MDLCGEWSRTYTSGRHRNLSVFNTNVFELIHLEINEGFDFRNPGSSCAYMNPPLGMKSLCKQKYSYKRLLALHPTEKRAYLDSFRFPSCCSCHVRTVDDFLGRSNFRKIDQITDADQ